ncbi:SusE domain-containing protein [Chitinophaga horti]|uniref:SusE domain-containing protein n=1 Tax=Chitinophaga horti TaxID=2920382 RepID=A0ABY6J3B4_9BACT|nr:SusE domain-containing protein [Chitinophaga horti]UYQ94160.1 SusE domain-containing protein [Chitinophaga horti]
MIRSIKSNIYSLLAATLAITTFASCEKDKEINSNISTVKELYYPEVGKYLKLQPATTAVVNFEWSPARAEDGSLVMYEVAFDTLGGDFQRPIYTVASNGNGVQNALSLSHKVLNTVASKAGIQPSTSGSLQWTVIASKGLNEKKAEASRVIVIERPSGFTEIPSNVFITGAATEGGADLASAKPMKLNADGVFEIFTRLKDGAYQFVDRNSGTPVTYSIQGTRLAEGGENQQAGDKVYRIRLDFANAAAEMTEITGVGVFASAYNRSVGNLAYAGNGTWTGTNLPIAYYDFGSWKDDRFKFQLLTADAGGTPGAMFYGSVNQSNSTPPDANTPEAYYSVVPVDNSQWDFTYKYPAGSDGKAGDFTLELNAAGDYKYKLTVR